MATVWDHLSVEELEERFVGCEDATASRHFQVIWLLARGHTISQVSGTTAYGERWIEQLLARYNAEGPEALGDLRRRNGAPATILKPDLLAKLRLRLDDPPPDGGLWSSRKVAAWMAGELNLTSVAPQRGWEALKAIGWSIQKPRPKNPKSAGPSGHRLCRRGVKSSLRREPDAPGDLLRALFGNMTEPGYAITAVHLPPREERLSFVLVHFNGSVGGHQDRATGLQSPFLSTRLV